jgi:predicted 2-oxoglutarate/Fe(II)-dependent dioxygenase YbiX
MQNELELHKDGSFLSVNILLSNPSDFEGGGTFFNDNTISSLEQGDVLVHSGNVMHSGVKIQKGTRYILVAFVSIIVNLKSECF